MSRPATALDLQVVPTPDGHDGACHVAATVFLPPSVERAPVLVLLPGGGYNGRYFDRPSRRPATPGSRTCSVGYGAAHWPTAMSRSRSQR